VASLGLVSPGAATDGVTILFLQKLATFLVIALCKVLTLFSCRLFWTSFFSSVLSKFSHKNNFIRVSPAWMVSPGAVRSLPDPLSDATDSNILQVSLILYGS